MSIVSRKTTIKNLNKAEWKKAYQDCQTFKDRKEEVANYIWEYEDENTFKPVSTLVMWELELNYQNDIKNKVKLPAEHQATE